MSDVPSTHPYQSQHATGLTSSQQTQQMLSQAPSSLQTPYASRYTLTNLPSPLGTSNTNQHGNSMDQLAYTSHASTGPSSNTVHMYAYQHSPSSYNTSPTPYPYHLQTTSHYAMPQPHPYHHPHRMKTNDPSEASVASSPKVHYTNMFGRATPPTYGHSTSSTMRSLASSMHPMMDYRVGPPLMAGHQPPPTFHPVPHNVGYHPPRSNLDLMTPQETASTSLVCGYCGTTHCQLIVQGCGHAFHHHCVLQTECKPTLHCYTCLQAIQRLKNLMSIHTTPTSTPSNSSRGTVNTLATYALMQPQHPSSFAVVPPLVSPTDSSSTEGMVYTQDPHSMMVMPSDLTSPPIVESSTNRPTMRIGDAKRVSKQQHSSKPPPIDTTREGETKETPSSTRSEKEKTVTRVKSTGKKVLKVCAMPNCGRTVRSRGLCKGHGGGRRCGYVGCGLSDQGGGFCISHGGGKRCQHPDCDNSAQSRGLCKLHGGGSRCQVRGCTKSSQGAGLCRAHGGGRRCQVEGCNKTDRRAGLCVSHGINRKCLVPDCSKTGRIDGLCSKHQYERTQTLAPLLTARRQMDEGVATLTGAAFALDGENEGQVVSRSIKSEERPRGQEEELEMGGSNTTSRPPSAATSPAFSVMTSLSLQSLFTPIASPTTPTALAGLMSTVESMRSRNQAEEHHVGMAYPDGEDGGSQGREGREREEEGEGKVLI